MKAKRFLAILLCILLVGSVFPAGLSAEEMVVDTEIATALEEAAQAQEGEDIQEVTMPDTETAAKSMEEEPQTPPEEIPEPPVSEAPATEAPVTEPPVTEAPVTEAPVTEPPVTEAPVTEQVVTESVATEAPVTEPVVTEPGSTEAPVTEPVVTDLDKADEDVTIKLSNADESAAFSTVPDPTNTKALTDNNSGKGLERGDNEKYLI